MARPFGNRFGSPWFSPAASFGSTGPLLALAVMVGAAGCGASSASAPPAAAPGATPAKTPVSAIQETLPAAAEPSQLLLLGRLAHPAAVFGTLSGWLRSQLPGSFALSSEVATQIFLGESMGPLLDLDQSVDLALSQKWDGGFPRIGVAASVALKSLDEAKKAFASVNVRLVPIAPGIQRLEGLGEPPEEEKANGGGEDEEERICAVVQAPRPLPDRIVCGLGQTEVLAMGPYLARTVPKLPIASDLHVESRLSQAQSALAKNRSMAGILVQVAAAKGHLTPAARDALGSFANAFLEGLLDLDGMALDAKVNDAFADLSMTMAFKSTASPLVKRWLAKAETPESGTDLLLRLPEQADEGGYHAGYGPPSPDGPLAMLSAAFKAELQARGVNEADAAAAVDSGLALLLEGPSAQASGFDSAAFEKWQAGARKKDSAGIKEADLQGALQGWRTGLVPIPAERLKERYAKLVDAWTKPSVMKWRKEHSLPYLPLRLRTLPLAKSANLPAGTAHYEWVMPIPTREDMAAAKSTLPEAPKAGRPEAAAKGKGVSSSSEVPTMVSHIFLVPDGNRTWVISAGSEAEGANVAKMALGTAPDQGLKRREGLDLIRQGSNDWAGFLTIRTLLRYGLGTLGDLMDTKGAAPPEVRTAQRAEKLLSVLKVVEGAPSKGRTPIPVVAKSTLEADGNHGSKTITLRLPRPAVEDATRLLMKAFAQGK